MNVYKIEMIWKREDDGVPFRTNEFVSAHRLLEAVSRASVLSAPADAFMYPKAKGHGTVIKAAFELLLSNEPGDA